MPKIGVVGVPGGWSSERLADVLEKKTGERFIISMDRVRTDLESGAVTDGDVDLTKFDALILKKVSREYSPHVLDRLEILRYVRDRGVLICSDPTSVLRLLDRLACTVTLASAGIPMPPTSITEDAAVAADIVADYGEAILKPLYSTKARGMEVLSPAPDLRNRIHRYQESFGPVLYLQKKLELPGRDLGLIFLGGEFLGAYARKAGGDSWNTTIRAGGKYEPVDPPKEMVDMAYKAQALFKMDYTGVDVAETRDGYVVFEVSAFGGFRGLHEATGVDPAERYADYVLEKLRHG